MPYHNLKWVSPNINNEDDEAYDVPRLRLEHDEAERRLKNLDNLELFGLDDYDIEIKVGNQVFQAHRNILAAGSDYMLALLCEDRFKDSRQESIEILDMATSTFQLFLEWLYDGICYPKESELMDLLGAASRLQCSDLISKIEETILTRIGADTCLIVWDAADSMNLTRLGEAAEAIALEVFEQVVASSHFKLLPVTKLLRLISNDELGVKKEESVFDSVILWIKAQPRTPSADEMSNIFNHIRFPCISEAFLTEYVEKEQLVVGNPSVMMSLYNSMKEKAYGKKTKRTTRRKGKKLSWEEIKQSTPIDVRIIDDIQLVKKLCKRPAPGAKTHSGWHSNKELDISRLLGSKFTVKGTDLSEEIRAVNIHVWYIPFDALERA